LQLASDLKDTSVTANWTSTRTGIQNAANALLWDKSAGLYKDNETTTLHPQDGNSYAVVSGLAPPSRSSTISAALSKRWIRPYGAPAPEAGATISPFASGFELRAHYAAGHAERAVELMEFMWADFMLDDPRMTNSTFIEGYSTNGELHYAPYKNDPRISHAHGWATAPTGALTMMGVGIQLAGPAGSKWVIRPGLGGLKSATAGFTTPLGAFSANWTDGGLSGEFEAPDGTTGSFVAAPIAGTTKVTISGPGGKVTKSSDESSSSVFDGLVGGKYTVAYE
jgi:hypothetical protein